MYIPHCVYPPSVDGHLGCVCLSATVNKCCYKSGVTSTQSVCPMFQKTKTHYVGVWSKERFVDGERANREDGGPLMVLKSIFRKYRVQASLLSREWKMGGAQGDYQDADIWAPSGI